MEKTERRLKCKHCDKYYRLMKDHLPERLDVCLTCQVQLETLEALFNVSDRLDIDNIDKSIKMIKKLKTLRELRKKNK